MSSKRSLEKLKYEEDQQAAAHVFQDFLSTFQSVSQPNKVFVKSATLLNPGGKESTTAAAGEVGRLYQPQPIYHQQRTAAGHNSTSKTALECARFIHEDQRNKHNTVARPKSNLELLKEELKLRHHERDQRRTTSNNNNNSRICQQQQSSVSSEDLFLDNQASTTNLFISNLSPKLTEQDLMVLFGEYGPLASVKIMWPRGEDRNRLTNCGFVAYMSRRDSEYALNTLIHRNDMRVTWGKAIDIPSVPVYIPPKLLKLLVPPPCSNLPFNAQPSSSVSPPTMANCRVKVTLPLDKQVLTLVNRMVEFVLREGPLFEAMIMNRELNNPLFNFLFDNKSATHTYYRWRLYSIAHGEATGEWSRAEFRMFRGGAVWTPPPAMPCFTLGMPAVLQQESSLSSSAGGGGMSSSEASSDDAEEELSTAQENRLIQFIQNLQPSRGDIRTVTLYCMHHARAYRTITSIISTSLQNSTTNPVRKLARLYLLSDILYNANKKNSLFLTAIQRDLVTIFASLENTLNNCLRLATDQQQFKSRVLRVLRAWEYCRLFPKSVLEDLESVFVGSSEEEEDQLISAAPLDGVKLRELSFNCGLLTHEIQDIQTSPNSRKTLTNKENISSGKLEGSRSHLAAPSVIDSSSSSKVLYGFVTSKWESVDPQHLEASAMSTKKLFELEEERRLLQQSSKCVVKTVKDCEKEDEIRAKLREIEVMVLRHQDGLESGEIEVKNGRRIEEEVASYRRKLMKKLDGKNARKLKYLR